MSQDSLHSIFDSTLHYGIKNDILSRTSFGQKYQDYYDDLSLIYNSEEKPDVSLMLNTAKLLYSMNTNFRYLKNYESNGDQIFIDTEMKNRVIELINEYKTIYNDDYTERIFQDILDDLNWAENRRVSEIIPRFLG